MTSGRGRDGRATVNPRKDSWWWNNYRARMDRKEEQCRECGTTEDLTFDHLVPVARGGSDGFANMTILCGPCNNARGTRPPSGHVRSLADEEADRPFEQQWSRHPLDPDSPLARRRMRLVRIDGFDVAVHLDEDQHGTLAAWNKHGCRCEVCRAWRTKDNARKNAARKARAGPLTHNPFTEAIANRDNELPGEP